MKKDPRIEMSETLVREITQGYDSGHDWWHIQRVRKLASYINEIEKLADPFTVEITSLLHDTVDSKFSGEDSEQGYLLIKNFLDENRMSEISEQVLYVMKNISFSVNTQPQPQPLADSYKTNDPLLHVVQDADRLDAIGAIGIARAFNYGGFRNNKIYYPDIIKPELTLNGSRQTGTSSTISHFYEKLLLLKYRMNTLTAKRLAVERHEFLEVFLKQFYKEWEFDFGIGSSTEE